ncbi:MAG: polysaccharide deacetylase family protein [Alphaproteobacteria bacterium]|nr:polysaccharide deacetylase family protein [Alphaproteobacteria bacterium]
MTAPLAWPGNARLALSIVVNVEEGAEMSVQDGDRGPEPVDELGLSLKKPIRNFGNESNYRYGIKAGAPRVFGLLRTHGVKATVTAAALSLERAPDLAAAIVADGHEICCHGHRWVHQFQMDEQAERTFIQNAVTSLEQSTGARPAGWLSRYLTSANTRRLLVDAGFLYHMDDYSDDLPFWSSEDGRPIVVMPYALDTNDMKLWTTPAYTPADWLQYAIDTFDWLYREGETAPKMMSLGLHLRVIGRPGRIGYLERFIEHVRRHDDVWIATRKEIATHFSAVCPFDQREGSG